MAGPRNLRGLRRWGDVADIVKNQVGNKILEQNPGWGKGTDWAKGDLPYSYK